MSLPDAAVNKIQYYFDREPTTICPVCGGLSFQAGTDLLHVPIREEGKIPIGGPGISMAYATCTQCAHMIFFAAKPLGFLKLVTKE